MEPRKLIKIMGLAEKLKNVPRHSYTTSGRVESVAEHCWRLCLMSYFVRDEFPNADMEKVMLMCLVHDLGEAFTGDIPAFEKTADNEKTEAAVINDWINTLPEVYRNELHDIFTEMEQRTTVEAKLFKALDNMEALIQHNEADIDTWLPLEYDLQLTYGVSNSEFSEYTKALRKQIYDDSEAKIKAKNKIM